MDKIEKELVEYDQVLSSEKNIREFEHVDPGSKTPLDEGSRVIHIMMLHIMTPRRVCSAGRARRGQWLFHHRHVLVLDNAKNKHVPADKILCLRNECGVEQRRCVGFVFASKAPCLDHFRWKISEGSSERTSCDRISSPLCDCIL